MHFENYIEDGFEIHFYKNLCGEKFLNKIVVKICPKGEASSRNFIKILLEEKLNQKLRISNKFSFQELIRADVFLPIEVDFLEREKQQFKTPSPKKLLTH